MIHRRAKRGCRGIAGLLTATLVAHFACHLSAQDTDASRYVSQSWKIQDGLPHNNVNKIAQTSDGYLWLATGDGLARFDGVRFTIFGLRHGLPSPQVLSLIEDRRGALWIATSRGLCRLQDGEFSTWSSKDGLAGDWLTSLAEDTNGCIWIGSDTGLSLWSDGKFRTFGKKDGLNDKRVRAVIATRDGGVLVSTFYEGLFQWNGNRFLQLPRPQDLPAAPPRCLLQDRQGNVWAGLPGGIILRHSKGEWRRYGHEHGLPPNIVLHLAEAADGTIWAAAGAGGLFSLETNAAGWKKVNSGDERILSILEDRERNLWVSAGRRGLIRLKSKTVSVISLEKEGIEAVPTTLAEAADGDLWVGTTSRGLFRVRDGKATPFSIGAPASGFPYVSAVLSGNDGSVWWGAGPSLFQWKNEVLAQSYSTEFRGWLREDRIRALSEDKQGGLWIGTQNGQLRLLREGEFLACTNAQPQAPVTTLLHEADGTLLVGTHGKGVLQVRNGQLVNERVLGESYPFIKTLYRDADGLLWVGTEGSGLLCLDNDRVIPLNTQTGLSSDTIVQILQSDDGHLWLGSYRGILRLNKDELKQLRAGAIRFLHPLILNRADGMLSEQCKPGFNGAHKGGNGFLYFSTDAGIVVVDPRRHIARDSAPKVWIEQVTVGGSVVYSRVQAWGRGKPGQRRDEDGFLRIPPGKRRLEFQYTGLNLAAPENVRFRYELEGLDEGWIEAGGGRMASYSLLPPGDYEFRVAACDSSGIWNEVPALVRLRVAPFFWQTWWFRLAFLAVLTGAVVAVVRYVSFRRLRSRLLALEQEAAVSKDRARIAKDLHDDLGANLSQVAMLSELAQTDLDARPVQTRTHLDQIFRTARSAARSLDEIVWAVNPGNDTLDRFSAHICTFAPEFLRAAGISCRLDVPIEFPGISLRSDVRHHLYLSLKETLHNVLKHAGATEVWIRMKTEDEQLSLVVEDNGRGYDSAETNPAGDGLFNLRDRMKEIGGHIDQRSEPGRGSSTTLTAPLCRAGISS